MSLNEALGALGGILSGALGKNVDITTTLGPQSNTEQCVVAINWTTQTTDGLFGTIQVDGCLVCKAVTNLGERIEDGTYTAKIDLSPHLQYRCPHIQVPVRDQLAGGDAGLRIHVLNDPCQSEGCVGPGDSIDGDAVDESKDAFNRLMQLLPQDEPFQVVISSSIAS